MAVVVTTASAFSIPAAAAGGDPPQQGGGCNMVFNPSSSGLDNMMTGSANGEGAQNMQEMLSRFSQYQFCTPPPPQ